MKITINLPPATLDQLKAEATATGEDVETVVREAVEMKMVLPRVSMRDVVSPSTRPLRRAAWRLMKPKRS